MNRARQLRFSAEGLTRIVGRRHLLRDISFMATGGECVALVGRNGAGKTTLLSLMAGRDPPDRGKVVLDRDQKEVTGREYGAVTAFLPHDLFIYPDLTARENLEFFATLQNAKDPGERASDALEKVGLADHADRVVRAFSRGMQQRVAVGRLLSSRATVWFMDEPSTGLDAPGRDWLTATLSAHVENGGLVFMASHSQDEVGAGGTRVMVLEAGRLVLDEPGGPEGARRAFQRMEGEGN